MLFFMKIISSQLLEQWIDAQRSTGWVRQCTHWHCPAQKVFKLPICMKKLGDAKPPAFPGLWKLSRRKNSWNCDISRMWLPKGLFKMQLPCPYLWFYPINRYLIVTLSLLSEQEKEFNELLCCHNKEIGALMLMCVSSYSGELRSLHRFFFPACLDWLPFFICWPDMMKNNVCCFLGELDTQHQIKCLNTCSGKKTDLLNGSIFL